MKKEAGNKIMLGVFVVGAFAFLIVGIYFIGQKQRLFSATFHIKTICRNVNGLQVGNNVRFSGINVGTVGDIQIISDTAVRIDMVMDKDVRKFIKKDAKASVGSEGLMGDKVVNIGGGSEGGTEIANNDIVQYEEGNTVDAILGQVKVVATNAAHITGDLSDIMADIHAGKGTIGKLFMDSSIARNLNQSLVSIKDGAGGFKQTMDAAQHNFLLRGYFKKKEAQEKAHQDSVAKGIVKK